MITWPRAHLLLLALTLVFALPAAAQQASFEQLGHWTAGPAQAVAAEGTTVFYGASANLRVADFSDPAAPAVLGGVDLSGIAAAIALSGDYAYVAQHDGTVSIVDVSDPGAPTLAGTVPLSGAADDVAVTGQQLYVLEARGFRGNLQVHVYDASDPTAPALQGSVATGQRGLSDVPSRLDALGDHVYVGADETLFVIDVSDPAAPSEAGRFEVPAPPFSTASVGAVHVVGDYAYVSALDSLRVLDISDPEAPVQVGATEASTGATGLVIQADYAYVTDRFREKGLHVVDVSAPAAPSEVAHFETGSFAADPEVLDLAVADGIAYVAADVGGIIAIDVSDPADPGEVSTLNTGEDTIDLAVSGGHAYVMQSRDASLNDGATTAIGEALRVVDLSDPAQPQTVGALEVDGEAHGIAARNSMVYMARGFQNGLVVIDATDPAAPQQVGTLDGPVMGVAAGPTYVYAVDEDADVLKTVDVSDPANPSVVGTYESEGSIVEMTLHGDFAYLTVRQPNDQAPQPDGLRVVDLSTPTSPSAAGFIALERANMVAAGDGRAYVTHFDEDSLHVVDVSDPDAPLLHSTVEVDANLEFADDLVYRNGFLFASAGSDGVVAIDVTDPAQPTAVSEYEVPGSPQGLTLSGDTIYVAAAEAGFVILDAEITGVAVEPTGAADAFRLTAAPNPFAEQAQLTLETPRTQHVRVAVFDVLGRRVRTLHEGRLPVGRKHYLTFEADDLPSGIYFLRATGEGTSTTHKVVRVD